MMEGKIDTNDMRHNGEWEVSAHSDGTSQVTKAGATYPIKFIIPTKDDPFAILFLLGFGGGLVAGDCVRIRGIVHDKAVAILKTQGSTKIFKSADGKECQQDFTASVGDNSLLAFLPDPTTCFKHARFRQKQRFDLHPNGSLIAVDWYTSGRMSYGSGESWELHRLQTRTEVFIGGRRVLLENLDLHDTPGIATAAEKVGNAGVFGNVVLAGPRTELIRTRAGAIMRRQTFKQRRECGDEACLGIIASSSSAVTAFPGGSSTSASASQQTTGERIKRVGIPVGEPLVSVSQLGDGLCIVRFAAHSTEDAYVFLAHLLSPLVGGGLSKLPHPYADRIHYSKPLFRTTSSTSSSDSSTTSTSSSDSSSRSIPTSSTVPSDIISHTTSSSTTDSTSTSTGATSGQSCDQQDQHQQLSARSHSRAVLAMMEFDRGQRSGAVNGISS